MLLSKKIAELNKQRTKLISFLFHEKPMVYGIPHEVFRKCGKKNCACAEGRPHGPYPALSANSAGRKKTVMIKKKDLPVILKEAKRYHFFQKTLSRIRKLDREIDSLLAEIKKKNTRNYL